jgi:acid stress-induced BolA-like protein IbaG/YrbA
MRKQEYRRWKKVVRRRKTGDGRKWSVTVVSGQKNAEARIQEMEESSQKTEDRRRKKVASHSGLWSEKCGSKNTGDGRKWPVTVVCGQKNAEARIQEMEESSQKTEDRRRKKVVSHSGQWSEKCGRKNTEDGRKLSVTVVSGQKNAEARIQKMEESSQSQKTGDRRKWSVTVVSGQSQSQLSALRFKLRTPHFRHSEL